MKPKTSPAFQFYASDFLGGSVATYSLEEIGLYSVLLAFDWSLNGLPKSDEKLSRISRVSVRKFRVLWKTVGTNFIERDGRYYNPRLELERKRQAEWREKSAKGGRSKPTRVVEPPLQPLPQPKGNTQSQSQSHTPLTTTTLPHEAAGTEKVTWLTPYANAWLEQYGGPINHGEAAKSLSPLHKKHGEPEAMRRWKIYLATTRGSFASPSRFASTWGEWDAPPPKKRGNLGEKEHIFPTPKTYVPEPVVEASPDASKKMLSEFQRAAGARA